MVFVKATRRVERDAELFANYGTKFRWWLSVPLVSSS